MHATLDTHCVDHLFVHVLVIDLDGQTSHLHVVSDILDLIKNSNNY